MFKRFLFVLAVTTVVSLIASQPTLLAHEGREVGDLEVEVGFLTEPAFEGQANGAFIRILKPAEEHAHNDSGAMQDMPDLEGHGALFSSGTIPAGGNFEVVFGHELEGLVVPFHDHLTGTGGSVSVANDGTLSGMVMVQFTHDGFFPSELSVQPGTTVMFMNESTDEVMTVLSGPHDAAAGHAHVPVVGVAGSLQVEVIHVPTGASKTMSLRPLFGQEGSYAADFVPTSPGAYSFRFFGEVEGEPFDETFTSGPGTFDEIEPARSVQFPVELRETRELQNALEGMQAEVELVGDTADDADSLASAALVIGIVGIVVGFVGAGIGGYGLAVVARRKG